MPPEERVATFDQDGTLWVSHPMYTQIALSASIGSRPSCKKHPELKIVEPFKTVLSGDQAAIAKLTQARPRDDRRGHADRDERRRLRGGREALDGAARDPRWKRPYTELVYQPMLEL